MSIAKSSSKPHLVVYTLKPGAERATMRSSYKSWFIGTIFGEERFFRIKAEHTHKHGYIWGYSHNGYGPYGGFGWVEAKDLIDPPSPATKRLAEDIMHGLDHPHSYRGPKFYHKFARHPYPNHSGQAKGKVHIRRGVQVPFYGNYHYDRGTLAGRQHRQHPFLTDRDDVRFRYVVRTNPHLIVVDYYIHNLPGPDDDHGIWGVIRRERLGGGHNFDYDAR